MAQSTYKGKYSPLSDGFEQQTRKRARRSSSATSVKDSPLPPVSTGQHNVPSKAKFVRMNIDDKMNSMFDMMLNMDTVSYNVDSLTRNMYFTFAKLDVSEARLRLLEYKSLDIETKMLRGNLIFTGIPETEQNENCVDLIVDILNEKLQFERGSMKINRAYRIGRRQATRYGRVPRNRAILVSFNDPNDTDEILRNSRLLKGSALGISRDYPREIRDARKELWPEYKEARNRHGGRNVKLQFPAALMVNGDRVRDLFPGWYSILQGSRNSDVRARVDEKFKRIVAESPQTLEAPMEEVIDESPSEPCSSDEEEADHPEQAATDNINEVASSQSQGLNSQPGYLLNVHGPIQQVTTPSGQAHVGELGTTETTNTKQRNDNTPVD